MLEICFKEIKITEEHFSFIKIFLKEKCGITIDSEKLYLVESRLIPVLESENFQDFDTLIEKIKHDRHGHLHQKIIDAMTTNETSFFRDRHPFETLKNTILPHLTKSMQTHNKINIWSAACSKGQEPYSIAMLIKEHFDNLQPYQYSIYASDISNDILKSAQSGIYTKFEINRGLSETYLNKYFAPNFTENEWRISEQIKNSVTFMKINLIDDWPLLPAMDVIFLRHVLIYFEIETRRNILRKIKKILKPDGYLFLGVGETPFGIDEEFESVYIGNSICYKLKQN